MPRSFRLDPVLEARLAEVAACEDVPVSVVVREAIARYCDAVLASDARARLSDVIGVVDSESANASQTGQASTSYRRGERTAQRGFFEP